MADLNELFKAGVYNGVQSYHCTAEDRIRAVRAFDPAQCEAALAMESRGLQKTVAQAVRRRMRELRKEARQTKRTAHDIPVKCTRCRHACMESDWIDEPIPKRPNCSQKVCPRCGCTAYYDLTPQVAWCWASGLIEIGDELPPDSPDGGGAIEIASGPKSSLRGVLEVVARHGMGASAGKLLVPGVPEANGQKAAADALSAWLGWCGHRKERNGVTFSKELRDAA